MIERMSVLFFVVVIVFTASVSARADESSVSCIVRSIHGLNREGGVDKELDDLKEQLAQPPFSAFKTLTQLANTTLDIPQGGKREMELPTEKILALTFKEKLLERKGQIRLRMYLTISPPNSKKFLPGTLFTIADGGTLLVAGDPFKGGTHIVGITCKSK